jgi:multidrug efflux pump
MDDSTRVAGMVGQLESSVLTAIALVMIVVLGSLGIRSALLVGFAIPTSFLLSFALMAVMGMSISNIVMFGLILAVGMLVDGAIVVVEYADKRIEAGQGPMRAFGEAAKRMFWPIVSSTATTLCAFLPMLFWPGMPGEFMGNLPVTLIFVLSASLVVALVYLPVMGGLAGRITRWLERGSEAARRLPWLIRAALLAGFAFGAASSLMALTGGTAPAAAAGLGFIVCAMLAAVMGGSLRRKGLPPVEKAGYRRTLFGRVIHGIVGNPVMPFVAVAVAVGAMVMTFNYYGTHSKGVEFFVKTEPERAVAYVRARGNLSLAEKDRLVRMVEARIIGIEGVESVFSFAGSGGLNQNRNGSGTPLDEVGQVQIELAPWGERGPGDAIIAEIEAAVASVPGIFVEVRNQAMGPAQGKPIHLRLTSDNWADLNAATVAVRGLLDATPGLIDVDDTRPLPGIDWEIAVDVEAAGRYGADVATVGAMVQLVTRGILLDTMRTETSDDEVEIRVRFPEADRLLSTLDTLRVRTSQGLVPLSAFIERRPVPKLGEINRFNTKRFLDVRADVTPGLVKLVSVTTDAAGAEVLTPVAMLRETAEAPAVTVADTGYAVVSLADPLALRAWQDAGGEGFRTVPVNANERIEVITAALAGAGLPATVAWAWTGDREEQEESQAFLGQAFAGALGLMFVILLAQFNSLYNSVLVLTAVVMSITGVLIGMLVMDQTFSIIMTGTGIVALAGIVVNNNIVLIDTFQEYRRQMPVLEAITRTAEARIRPVLLTTITTMAGLAPMMFGISVDFARGGYSIDAPTALWWKQLATAVVWGLGVATLLTLIVTPALLAARYWIGHGVARVVARLGAESAQLRRLRSWARRTPAGDLVWDDEPAPVRAPLRPLRLDAAE